MTKHTANANTNINPKVSFDDFDDLHYPRAETTDFDHIVHRLLNRRDFLGGGLKLGAGSLALGFGLTACSTSSKRADAPARSVNILEHFANVPANSRDTVTVPEGFNWHVVATWGDPLWSDGAAFDEATRGTAASQQRAFGDNTDGMAMFQDPATGKYVLVVNNEYTNLELIHGNRADGKPANQDDVMKNMYAHGVSVVEVKKTGKTWGIVKDSPYNRRITPETTMAITGPARGHDLLKTKSDATDRTTTGTWNNCGNGRTPWGTYLACKENFNGYFSAPNNPDYQSPAAFKRYGIGARDWGYAWATADSRFDVEAEPNMANTAGYVVEIDPFNASATPRKLTALGRFKHENAEVVIADSGKVVVYMGDDERGKFIYRFVSKGTYKGGNGSALLEEGTLYVAKFNDDQTGEWLALTSQTTGMSEAEIAVHSRMAGSKVGATTMDRPEWVASNPNNNDVFCCLTNNKNRGIKPNAGGDATPVGGPNPRKKNIYGQIVRWSPANGAHDADAFTWDLYAMAGNPAVKDSMEAGSANINENNMFNSPDGLGIDPVGNLWIQTDGKYSNEGDFQGMGNNQMLIGDSQTGEIKRFLVGPVACEVTGITFSPDRTTAFVGIQHPGEDNEPSTFPNGGVPRSAVIAIQRNDGGALA